MLRLLFSILFFHSIAFGEINPKCKKANLGALYYQDEEHCRNVVIRSELIPVLEQIAELNSKAFAALSLPLDLPLSFSLFLVEEEFGPIASWVQKSDMTLGILPHPQLPHLNPPVYLHELGHILSLAHNSDQNNKMPKYFKFIARNSLLLEVLADFLSLSIEGRFMSPFLELPPCLDRVRYLGEGKVSFKRAVGYFLEDFTPRRIQQCCKSKIRFAEMNEYWQGVCSAHVDSVESKFQTQVLNESLIIQHSQKKNTLQLDPHQLSLPVNSFAKALAEILEITLPELLQKLISSQDKITKPLVCRVKGRKALVTQVARMTLNGVFDTFRAQLTVEQNQKFCEAWDSRGMDLLFIVENYLDDAKIKADAVKQLERIARKLKQKPFSAKAVTCESSTKTAALNTD